MIPNIFSLLGESIVGKHIAKGIIFSNSPKKFHPNGSRIQVKVKKLDIFNNIVGYFVKKMYNICTGQYFEIKLDNKCRFCNKD